MSKSFDRKIGDRLSEYTSQPPEYAKDTILKEVAAQDYSSSAVYHGLASLLILLALFEIGKVDQSARSETVELNYSVKPEAKESKVLPVKPITDLKGIQEEEQPVVIEPAIRNNIQKERNDKQYQSFHSNFDLHQSNSYGITGLITPLERPVTLSLRKTRFRPGRIIPEKPRWVEPYFSMGAFFTYNRVRPNLTDDIYVGEYASPFGISSSRLGFLGEAGLEKNWSGLFATRIGISINNYKQHYSFTIRSTKPDSVGVNAETGFLEPQFETENIRISQRVTTAGLKLTSLWHIFPGRNDVLFGSLEYQRLLGNGPRFSYEGEEYRLMRPSQIMVEAGLKKTIAEMRSGDIYVMPNIRYAITDSRDDQIISVKPFSVGVTISYGLK